MRNSICALQVVKDVFGYHSDSYLNVRVVICYVVGFTSKMGSVALVMICCDIYLLQLGFHLVAVIGKLVQK